MARNEQLIRQHKILQVLERRRYGATLEDLRNTIVEELGLSSLHVRSVRRDLEALQAAGMDLLQEETQNGKVWKLSRTDRGLHKLSITASELIALSMGRDLLVPLVGTQFWQGIEGFWNKVREQLPAGVWEHYQRYRRTLRVIGVPSKTYEKQQGILKTINRAIQEHRRLLIEYQSVGRPTPSIRTLEPYGLAIYQSSIYVIAVETGRDEDKEPEERLRHWKLDRFTKADALDDWFKPDEDIDLQEHLGQSVGIFSGDKTTEYTIRLTASAARWIQEDPWHPKQELLQQPDGSFLLKIQAYQDTEVIQKVMFLGTEAEIIAPPRCRKAIRDIVNNLALAYRNNH